MLTPVQVLTRCLAVCAGPHLCAICGGAGAAVPVREAIGDSFLDHTRCAAWGTGYVCAACVYCMGRLNSVPGVSGAGNWRNYSYVATPEGGSTHSKGDKPGLEAALWAAIASGRPWSCGVGLTGQKYSVLWMRWNLLCSEDHGRYSPERLRQVCDLIRPVVVAGVPKGAILDGDYGPGLLRAYGGMLLALERALRPYRGTPELGLACWLVTRPDVAEEVPDADE